MSKTGAIIFTIYVFLSLSIVTGFTTYNIAHTKGYMHGANQVIEYYEATNEFPSEQWLKDFEETRFNDKQEILDTLRPYDN